jgi:hypothetical protein
MLNHATTSCHKIFTSLKKLINIGKEKYLKNKPHFDWKNESAVCFQ